MKAFIIIQANSFDEELNHLWTCIIAGFISSWNIKQRSNTSLSRCKVLRRQD